MHGCRRINKQVTTSKAETVLLGDNQGILREAHRAYQHSLPYNIVRLSLIYLCSPT
jgi:hypothetical protein